MTRSSRKRWFIIFALGLLSILLFVACKPAQTSTLPSEAEDISLNRADSSAQPYPGVQVDSAPSNEVQSSLSTEGLAAPDPYPAPGESGPPQQAEVQQAENEPPRLKTGLEATDPATVSLAAGEIQLVEFFAFW